MLKQLTFSFDPPQPQRADQSGANNPNWRGGMVPVSCEICGQEKKVIPARAKIFRCCSRQCLAVLNARRWSGESSPIWKGGSSASKARYRAKKGLSSPRPKKARLCKACGLDGVKKGRSLHPECRPVPKHPIVERICIDCGNRRTGYERRPTKRCRKCDLAARAGPANSNWKGGITPENRRLRASDEYKAWRTAVFERDQYTCVECGQVGWGLHADHIKPWCAFPALRFSVDNGRTLCVACHKKTDTWMAGALKYKAPEEAS